MGRKEVAEPRMAEPDNPCFDLAEAARVLRRKDRATPIIDALSGASALALIQRGCISESIMEEARRDYALRHGGDGEGWTPTTYLYVAVRRRFPCDPPPDRYGSLTSIVRPMTEDDRQAVYNRSRLFPETDGVHGAFGMAGVKVRHRRGRYSDDND
jgi:hypothetical protein